MNVTEILAANAALVDEALVGYTAEEDEDFARELAAERYSLLARAKRIRPTLVLEFCRLFGGSDEAALPFACAVEMVHTYSLIHDDLPCMDDDDLRRGRPTCHKAFDEATALLAGDGLLTRAFGVLATAPVSDAAVRRAVAVLSRGAGSFGMIGGQVMDLAGEAKRLPLPALLKLHAHKTGALIALSAELGCIAAGLLPEDPRITAAKRYAQAIGLAFQIVDDVLDVTADAATLGKNIGSDAKSEKTTFLSFYDAQGALAYARRVTQDAKSALDAFPGNERLLRLADFLLERNY
ncbi:MAG: polyprenyl synthetase family protein [Ruminococcaceae bacterium]|nr:polyprenyl synthetase family protein [Oscillospiraceae bacterium]